MSPRRRHPTLGFIGVTASASSINAVFPRWAAELGFDDARLEPFDLPLDTSPRRYREVVADIREDPQFRGALVTTHKVRLLEAAHDLFDELDPHAQLCREVSCISQRDGRLIGHAKDPVTAGRSLDETLAGDHFRHGAEALCLGAGGAGLAISISLLSRDDPPRRLLLVDTDPRRLDECRRAHGELPATAAPVEYVLAGDPARNDELVAGLADGSLVVNATGMGKDRPGSPVTDAVRFPLRGVVWELNYRGELDFLHQARAQAGQRRLVVEDGWRYFVHGWSEVVAEVFHLDLTPALLARLDAAARAVRS